MLFGGSAPSASLQTACPARGTHRQEPVHAKSSIAAVSVCRRRCAASLAAGEQSRLLLGFAGFRYMSRAVSTTFLRYR